MRHDVINDLHSAVNAFQVPRPSKGYDYRNARRRMIFEALTQGVQYDYNNAVEGDIAEFGTASGFSSLTIAYAMAIYRQIYEKFQRQHALPPKRLWLFDSFQGLPDAISSIDIDSPNVASG